MLIDPSKVSERFVIEGRVGGGAAGDIFKAIDQTTAAPVALKVLRITASDGERARFLREIRVIADLRHPNIVEYVAHGTLPDGRLFMAMEWLEGEDLAKRQRRAPLGTRDAVEVVRRAAQALAAIHARDIVHRDLKLSNMFLVRGRGTAVKLIDFGVVKLTDPEADYETEAGTILGTPHYMSPEQARGEAVDPRADVYSLGSVLFRLLTGRHVFETEHVIALLGRLVLEDPPHPSGFRFDIPDKLDAVVYRAISRNKDERYENAGEFARALARVGPVNNDPPQVERSASAVLLRRQRDTKSDTGSTGNRPTRPGLRTRRVVACMLYDLGDTPLEGDSNKIADTLRDLAGEDVRIEQLAGGKTVAVMGVEHSRGDEVMRAARAALQVVKDYPRARAVVSVGHAVMARSNLAGEALDRAAHQLGAASPGAVRLDMHAAASLELRFELDRDGDGATLVREDPRDLAPRNVLGQPTPTVGREKEIAELQALYDDMLRDSFPRAALITGVQGIGKSRVRSELVQRLELAPVPPELLVVRCDSAAGGTSASALGRALRMTMGVVDGGDHAEQVQLVKRFVRARLPRSLSFLAAFIGELVAVPFPEQNDEPLRAARANDQLMQSRIRMAFEAFVRTQAGRIPQVIVLEDAELADDTTLSLIDWVLTCPDVRFAALAFARPEIDARRADLWSAARLTRIPLGPLPASMAERIIVTVLPSSSPQIRDRLVRRAAGNPLVLEELVRCAAEGSDELPLTVQAMVQRRLDRLPASVREVVRTAALFGRYFWAGGVAALLEREVDDDLATAEKEEIVLVQGEETSRVTGQAQWMFRQSLVRDAAYASLLDDDKKTLHIAAAEWLESVGDVDFGLVAYHFERGADNTRAAQLYARATQQALASFGQMDMALDLAQRGLECGAEGTDRAQLLLTRAHVLHRTGNLTLSMEAAEQCAKLTPEASDTWVEVQRILGSSLIEAGRATEGDARLGWALGAQFANQLSAAMRATLLSARVRGLINLNRPGQALSVSEQAVSAATSAGADGERALLFALDARLFALMSACAPADAVEAGYRLIETADRAGDIHLASRGRINVASSLNYLGCYEDAQALLERALTDVRGFRLRLLEALCIHNLGMARARLGDLSTAVEMEREAQRIADECKGARVGINARIYESLMLVWRGEPGDLRRAHELASYALEATQQHPGLQVIAMFMVAKVQLARQFIADALESAHEAHRRLGDGPVEEWDEHIRNVFIETLLTAGEEGYADEVLRTAFEAVRQRASAIRSDDLRQSFVTRNVEVRQLLTLAQQRLGLTR